MADLPRGSLQVAKLSTSDIRPSVRLPYVLARARSERVVARNGICVAPGRPRPHRRRRDRALSSVSTQPRCSAEAAERRPPTHPSQVAFPPRRAPACPFSGSSRATHCLHDPRGSITREDAPNFSHRVHCTRSGKVSGSFSIPSVRGPIYLS